MIAESDIIIEENHEMKEWVRILKIQIWATIN